MQEIDVAERLLRVREAIAEGCHRAGRAAGEVRLVAVSKRVPLARVVAAVREGQRDLGENRVQEALSHQQELPALLAAAGVSAPDLRWHFVGHLQRNKAGQAIGAFVLLHAVDSPRLVTRLEELAAARSIRQPILIEVNQSREPQKQGVAPDSALSLLEQAAGCPHLDLQGLMTMARFGAPEAELRRTFAGLRGLAERARTALDLPLPHLSMGMTDDFLAAIAEGATIVRIGTAIFGARQ